ncbi:lectin-like [Lates calcarifer]|uniref:Lectin-like n=1 Tax=Lates calcarifer TaxID=8187 RepID=A0AAJ8DQ33_LATCA|nr:lectin-like [Lates calcarifer]
MTWTEAQSYCRANHTDLASVRNTVENQRVTQVISSTPEVWIGLFRDSWKWSDGSNSSFRYWITGEPNGGTENCVAANFNNSGKWEDQHCGQRRAFICYSPPVSKKVVRVRLMKKSSSLDLNDPAVMEDILRELKQKLKDKGVDGDVKLSWRKQSDGKVFHKEKETEKKTTKKRDEL